MASSKASTTYASSSLPKQLLLPAHCCADESTSSPKPTNEEPFPGLSKIPKLLIKCYQQHNKSSLNSTVGLRFVASCEKPEGPYIKITLVDCEERKIITEQSCIPYVALSYVWGSITKPMPLMEGQKLPNQVSRTIEDAITVTRYLGMRFLWVDQYCIDQDNESIKAKQISQMHEVYRHAELTIAAATGDNAEAGLAPMCTPCDASVAWYAGIDDAGNPFLFEADAQGQVAAALDSIASSTWNTRAWTYQESYVSRRLLVFHARGMYYECYATSTTYRYETDIDEPMSATDSYWTGTSLGNGPVQRAFAMEGSPRDKDVISWLVSLITTYSCRNLKFQDDALRAFSAVLQDFQGMELYPLCTDPDYGEEDESWEQDCRIGIVQGLPFYYKSDQEPDVMGWEFMNAHLNTFGLCWHHRVEGNQRRDAFPSWSWIGWHGPMLWIVPRAYYTETTAFQLEVVGFRAGLEEEHEVMDLDEARLCEIPPSVLRVASVAVPAEAFAVTSGDEEGNVQDRIYMYGCAISCSLEECTANSNNTAKYIYPRNYFGHAEGARLVSCQSLQRGLQGGLYKLMLVHVYGEAHVDEITRLQAWLLRKAINKQGTLYYERFGGISQTGLDKGEKVIGRGLQNFLAQSHLLGYGHKSLHGPEEILAHLGPAFLQHRVEHVTGSLNDDPDDPWRHGLGLMTVAKVFQNLITKEEDVSFAFPYASHDRGQLDSVPDTRIGIASKHLGTFTKTVSTASELQDVLSTNTYVVVDFYTDYDGTHATHMSFRVANLAKDHAIHGVLAVVIANMDDMNTLAAHYCKEGPRKETFVFFKEGKQVAVNGKTALYGKQIEALAAAVEKLGTLARKRSQANNATT